ncbi:MAG: Ca-activated chloride channel [Acidobacteriota bacterium]|jgi:VWFA-related protein|nr:Ca-activated chloride channel [Acidobacteriota bacterium]
MRASHKLLVASLLLLASLVLAIGQAGRRPRPTNEGSISLNVVAVRENDSKGPITSKQISLYDGGIEQTVKNFSLDPSPARIVLLVDNSLTIRADVEKLEAAAREFAYEIFEGDKLLIVGYDEQAEIVADWTDDAKQIEKSLASFRKKGEPHLFDALSAVSQEALLQLKATNQKRIIVVISDGLDRGSKTKFDRILSELQSQDITVYAVQAPDRTGGALRRDQPKPVQVIEKLVEGTGGRIFPINAPQEAAKAICDELRKSRYILSYAPTNVAFGDSRRLLVIADSGINVRAKTLQPPN